MDNNSNPIVDTMGGTCGIVGIPILPREAVEATTVVVSMLKIVWGIINAAEAMLRYRKSHEID